MCKYINKWARGVGTRRGDQRNACTLTASWPMWISRRMWVSGRRCALGTRRNLAASCAAAPRDVSKIAAQRATGLKNSRHSTERLGRRAPQPQPGAARPTTPRGRRRPRRAARHWSAPRRGDARLGGAYSGDPSRRRFVGSRRGPPRGDPAPSARRGDVPGIDALISQSESRSL